MRRGEQQPEGYLAFMPSTLPPELPPLPDSSTFWLSAASQAVGRLSGFSRSLPNRDLFVGMYVRKEAILSSWIEGIDAGRPIGLELFRNLHAILMPGTRGGDKKPGQFRDEQNWIGHPGSTAFNARYVPPPVERMQMALANLAHYISEHQGHAPLVRCAIAHAQFETIHPFHDGNGRMGRLLVALMLKREKVLESPCST